MTRYLILFLFALLPALVSAQGKLTGHVFYQSSGKKPAVGVRVDAKGSNGDYSREEGEYTLVFPHFPAGQTVSPFIGEGQTARDALGNPIELVNDKELRFVSLPADPASAPLDIIVCPKGARDLAARKYYRILKSSSEEAVLAMRSKLDRLLEEKERDISRILELGEQVQKLEQQADSARIYREAWQIASINRDGASDRVLQYLDLLDQGKSVQEARKALDIGEASNELRKGVRGIRAAMNELETRAGASAAIFDYPDVISCYDTLLKYGQELGLSELKLAETSLQLGYYQMENGDYRDAIENLERGLAWSKSVAGFPDSTRVRLLNQLGKAHGFLGEFDAEMQHYQTAWELVEELPDLPAFFGSSTLNNLGTACHSVERYPEARDYYLKAIKFLEAAEHPDTASLSIYHDNLGHSLMQMDEFVAALAHADTAIQFRSNLLPPNHPDIARSLEGIGLLQMKTGNYSESIKTHLKALRIKEQSLRMDHPETAISYNNLGLAYLDDAKVDSALYYLKEALRIQQANFGDTHPETARTHINLASAFGAKGDYQMAEKYLRKAIDIRKRLPGKTILLAQAYENLASLFHNRQLFEKALPVIDTALQILEASEFQSRGNLADAYSTRGNIYLGLGMIQPATEDYSKALALAEGRWPADHPFRADLNLYLGNAKYLMEQYDSSLYYYHLSEAILESRFGPDHPRLAMLYNAKAVTYDALEDWQQGVIYFDRARKLLEPQLGPDHPQLAVLYQNIGGMYRTMGNIDAALNAYLEAYRIYDLNPAMNLDDRLITCVWAGKLNLAKEDFEQATEYNGRAVELAGKDPEKYIYILGASHLNLSLAQKGLQEYALAQENADRALEIFHSILPEDHPDIQFTQDHLIGLEYDLAIISYKDKEYSKALSQFRAITQKKEFRDVWIYSGLCLYKTDSLEQALQSYERARELDVDSTFLNGNFYAFIGMVHCRMGQLKEARAAFDAFDLLQAGSAASWRNRGLLHAAEGNVPEAIKALEKAAENGFNNLSWLETEPGLDALRTNPRFQELLKRLKE